MQKKRKHFFLNYIAIADIGYRYIDICISAVSISFAYLCLKCLITKIEQSVQNKRLPLLLEDKERRFLRCC